jgi:hypothetical protein
MAATDRRTEPILAIDIGLDRNGAPAINLYINAVRAGGWPFRSLDFIFMDAELNFTTRELIVWEIFLRHPEIRDGKKISLFLGGPLAIGKIVDEGVEPPPADVLAFFGADVQVAGQQGTENPGDVGQTKEPQTQITRVAIEQLTDGFETSELFPLLKPNFSDDIPDAVELARLSVHFPNLRARADS